jgi:hypothetical protein
MFGGSGGISGRGGKASGITPTARNRQRLELQVPHVRHRGDDDLVTALIAGDGERPFDQPTADPAAQLPFQHGDVRDLVDPVRTQAAA